MPPVQSLDSLAPPPMEPTRFLVSSLGPSNLTGPRTLTLCSSPRALLLGLAAAGAAVDGAATRGAGGSAIIDRGIHRQGAACRERHLSLVSGLGHQIDDRLHDAARHQGTPHRFRYAADHVAQCGGAAADQNGLQARHHRHRRQRAEDADGQIRQRYRGSDCRRGRRLARGLRRHDEYQCPPAWHVAIPFHQSERTAGGKSRHLGARSRHSGARADPRVPGSRFVLAHFGDPLRQSRAAQLQFADRSLSRRRRHEDRLHLRLRI